MNSINSNAINNGPIPAILEQGSWSLNGFDLCGEATAMQFPDINNTEYNLNTVVNPYIDGSVVLSRLLNEKTITIDVMLKKDTLPELNELIDEFKQAMNFSEAKFTVPVYLTTGTEIREIIVSQKSISFEEPDKTTPTYKRCTIELLATATPRYYAQNTEAKTYKSVSGNLSADISNIGSAKTYPEFYLLFLETNLTGLTINYSGYTLTINTAITTGDILQINTDPNLGGFVKLNGVEIDYNGRLDNQLETGTNIVKFEFTGTLLCNLSVLYKKTYE